MSIRAMIEANPSFRTMQARDAFAATVEVALRDWANLDLASWWCEQGWLCHGLHYRRHVRADVCRAVFEFNDEYHALKCMLRYG